MTFRIAKFYWLVPVIASWSVAHADLALEMNVTKSTNGPPDTQTEQEAQETTLYVVLAANQMHIRTAGSEMYYDFETQRVYSIDRESQTFRDRSLYAGIGFRDYEIRNREYLVDLLEAAAVKDSPMKLVHSEHELSVQSDNANTSVDQIVSDGSTRFQSVGDDLMSVSMARTEIPAIYVRPFVRFFRHWFGGHPKIVDTVANDAGIANEVVLHFYGVAPHRLEIDLVSVEIVGERESGLAGLRLESGDNTPVGQLVANIGVAPEDAVEAAQTEVLERARTGQKNGDLANALLAYLEHYLMTGEVQQSWSESEREQLAASEEVNRILRVAGNPASADEARELIVVSESLREKLENQATLKVFEANIQASIGETETAKELMLEALDENPYITGAWKDLGGFYFVDYDAEAAWMCWDTGRRINPDHPLMTEIDGFEAQLRAKHPGFF